MATITSSDGFIPSSKDTPLDKRTRVNSYEEIQNIKNPYVGMEILVLSDETNDNKKTIYKVMNLKANENGIEGTAIDVDTLITVEEFLGIDSIIPEDGAIIFGGQCEETEEIIELQPKTDNNLNTVNKKIVEAINELKANIDSLNAGGESSGDGTVTTLPFNTIDKGLASSNIDFSEIKNGSYCYIIRGSIGYDVPEGNLPLNNDMVHITKSNIAMTVITLNGDIYTYNGGTNGTDYISCTKDNFMTYSVANETYQLKNDSKLITTDKTVVGAINELKNALDSVDGAFTILTVSPTYEELDTLPEGSKVYILNGLGYNGDPVRINKSSNTITLIGIDGAINKYQKVGNSWSNYSTENWATQKYVDTAIANVQLGGESGSVDLSEYQKITDSSLATTDKNIVGAINEVKTNVDSITVPTKVSDLTNDSNFVNETQLNEAIAGISSGGSGDCCIKRITIEEGNPTNINTLCASIKSKIGTDYQAGDILTGYANLITLNYGDTSKTDSGTLVVYIERYGHSIVFLYSQNDGAIYSGTLSELAMYGNLVKVGEVDLSEYQTITDNSLTTTDKTIVGAINEVKTNVDSIEIPNVSNYQTKNDSTLTTTNKTIVGSINEIKANVDGITIPSAVSELTNDSGFITSDDIPTIPTKTSQLTNDSGFLDSTKVIVVNKGNANTLVDLDNDISVGKNAILLTGTVAQSSYDNELVYIDKRSSTSMYIYSMRGNKLFVMKSGSSWFQAENVNSIYPTDTISSLTTTAKTIPGAIDELKRGLSGLQPKTDNSLTTTDKTITGAINELKSGLDAVTASATSNLSIEQNYSVDETLTGGTWIDGKSIYRKVIDCGELPNGTEKSVSHGITNLDTIISINGVAISSENTIPLPYIHQTTTDIVQILCTPTEVKITTTSDKTAYTKSYVTVEYTKATESI